MNNIGNRFKQMRKQLNINQVECANKIGISQGTLSDIEKNKTKPSVDTVISASRYFGVTPGWLLTGENDTIKLEGNEIPANLRKIGINYLTLAKRMQDKAIPPEDIEKIIDIITKK